MNRNRLGMLAIAACVAIAAGAVIAAAPDAPPDSRKKTHAALAEAFAALSDDAKARLRVSEYWNNAIWQGVGSRYPNDWNRNVGTIMRTDGRRAGFLYIARDAAARAELIRSANTDGVPAELAAMGERLAELYESLSASIAERFAGGEGGVDADRGANLQEALEELRTELNRRLGLDLAPVTIVN